MAFVIVLLCGLYVNITGSTMSDTYLAGYADGRETAAPAIKDATYTRTDYVNGMHWFSVAMLIIAVLVFIVFFGLSIGNNRKYARDAGSTITTGIQAKKDAKNRIPTTPRNSLVVSNSVPSSPRNSLSSTRGLRRSQSFSNAQGTRSSSLSRNRSAIGPGPSASPSPSGSPISQNQA